MFITCNVPSIGNAGLKRAYTTIFRLAARGPTRSVTFATHLQLVWGLIKINDGSCLVATSFCSRIPFASGAPSDAGTRIHSNYLVPSLIIGLLFIITFNLVAFGTQKIGIAKSKNENTCTGFVSKHFLFSRLVFVFFTVVKNTD